MTAEMAAGASFFPMMLQGWDVVTMKYRDSPVEAALGPVYGHWSDLLKAGGQSIASQDMYRMNLWMAGLVPNWYLPGIVGYAPRTKLYEKLKREHKAEAERKRRMKGR
jgi:hypothetical protein